MTRIHLDKLVREKKNAEYHGISDARKFIKPLELFVIWRKLKVSGKTFISIYTFSKSCHRHLSRFENSSKLFACASPEFFQLLLYLCMLFLFLQNKTENNMMYGM